MLNPPTSEGEQEGKQEGYTSTAAFLLTSHIQRVKQIDGGGSSPIRHGGEKH